MMYSFWEWLHIVNFKQNIPRQLEAIQVVAEVKAYENEKYRPKQVFSVQESTVVIVLVGEYREIKFGKSYFNVNCLSERLLYIVVVAVDCRTTKSGFN